MSVEIKYECDLCKKTKSADDLKSFNMTLNAGHEYKHLSKAQPDSLSHICTRCISFLKGVELPIIGCSGDPSNCENNEGYGCCPTKDKMK